MYTLASDFVAAGALSDTAGGLSDK